MAEAFRSDDPLRNPKYPQGAERPGGEFAVSDPEHSFAAGNICKTRADRSARAIGYGVGAAVSRVRQMERRVDDARSHLREASGRARANASAVALELMDSAAQRAENIRRATQNTVSDWAETAGARASHLGDRASSTWQELQRSASARMEQARRRAASQWNHVQHTVHHLQQEEPAKFLAVVAGTAFVIGAGLRVWRSSND